jgi:hydroxyacylglutathione hydrolase
MISIKTFTFNPFQENTYILYDESLASAIVDPGCSNSQERKMLVDFINLNKLKPVKLLNTHCHIDHILGNKFIADTYNLGLEANENDLRTLEAGKVSAEIFGIEYELSPLPSVFLNEGDTIMFGDSELEILFTPGHSMGSICFLNRKDKFIIGGDVLFYQSIGRTDLPGGNHNQLLQSIRTKLFTLPNDFIVYSGHGTTTTIGFEKLNNPFLN